MWSLGAAHEDDRFPEQPKQHGSVKFRGSHAFQGNFLGDYL